MIRSRLKSVVRRAMGGSSKKKQPEAAKPVAARPVAARPVAAKPVAAAGGADPQSAARPGAPSGGLVLPSVGEASGGLASEAAPPAAAPAAAGSFANIAALAAAGGLGKAAHADMASTDLEAYKARALANNRDLELAGEGMNTAADGTKFWGPVDNESSRAKAAGMELQIDQIECISCGTCEESTNAVFHLPEGKDEEYKATVIAQDGPMDLIQDAIEACPVTCISWEASTGGEHPSTRGLQPEVDAAAMEYYQRLEAAAE